MSLYNWAKFNDNLNSESPGSYTSAWAMSSGSPNYQPVTTYGTNGIQVASGAFGGSAPRVSLNGVQSDKYSFSFVYKTPTTWAGSPEGTVFLFGNAPTNGMILFLAGGDGAAYVTPNQFEKYINIKTALKNAWTGIGAEIKIGVTFDMSAPSNTRINCYINGSLVTPDAKGDSNGSISGPWGASDYFQLGNMTLGYGAGAIGGTFDNPVIWDNEIITDFSYMNQENPTGAVPMSISTTSLSIAKVNSSYYMALIGLGGTGTRTWSMTPGSPSLPAWASLNTGAGPGYNGVISGTPTTESITEDLQFRLTGEGVDPLFVDSVAMDLVVNPGTGQFELENSSGTIIMASIRRYVQDSEPTEARPGDEWLNSSNVLKKRNYADTAWLTITTS